MIITENVLRDTYVTNIKTTFNDGLLSNVGQASTLDIFKLCNENSKATPQALLVLNSIPQDGSTFTIKDAANVELTFEFNSQTNNNIPINVVLDGLNLDSESTVNNIVNKINSVLSFQVEAYKLYSNKILLKQSTTDSLSNQATNNRATLTQAFDVTAIADGDVVELFLPKEIINSGNPQSRVQDDVTLKFLFNSDFSAAIGDLPKDTIEMRIGGNPADDVVASFLVTFLNSNSPITALDQEVTTPNVRYHELSINPIEVFNNEASIFAGDPDGSSVTVILNPGIEGDEAFLVQTAVVGRTMIPADLGEKLFFKGATSNSSSASSEPSIVGSNGVTGITFYDFKKIEHSAILLEIDLDSFKFKNVENITNSVFNINDDKTKFILTLTDVGASSSKPFDFKLRINALNQGFEEGSGRDTIHFSDEGSANFKYLNEKDNITWNIPGMVSSQDILGSQFLDEEVFFDIDSIDYKVNLTSYIKNYLNETAGYTSKYFVIHIDPVWLFDNYTYFVKRFASRDVSNKFFTPRLDIMIKDSSIENILATDKKRYIDNQETFYLCNIQGNTLKKFLKNDQGEYIDVKLKISYLDSNGANIFEQNAAHEQTGTIVYNYKGQALQGIRKFIIPESLISILQSNQKFQKEMQDNEKVKITLNYFYDNNGTETPVREETHDFHKTENQSKLYSLSKTNIRCSISKLSEKILADDSIKKFKISFIDIYKQYDSVSIPYDLTSEDLGEVNYSMFDIDSGKEIISKDNEYTSLFYDGLNYIMNLYSSSNFKNRRANFIFYYSDPITGLQNKIINDNNIIKFE